MVRQFIFNIFQNTNGFTDFTVDQVNMIIPIKGTVYNNSKKSTRHETSRSLSATAELFVSVRCQCPLGSTGL